MSHTLAVTCVFNLKALSNSGFLESCSHFDPCSALIEFCPFYSVLFVFVAKVQFVFITGTANWPLTSGGESLHHGLCRTVGSS